MDLQISETLGIQDFVPGDAPDLFALMTDGAVMRFLPDRLESVEEASGILGWLIGNYGKQEFVRRTHKIVYEGRFSGWVSVGPLPWDESKREIAYAVTPAYWGRGIATAAVRAFVQHVFRDLSPDDLYAEVHEENVGSIRVLERNAFCFQSPFLDEHGARKRLYRKTSDQGSRPSSARG